MIELHERLSEFSYGYGVTREVDKLLGSLGIQSVPFLPSLLDENQVGFDVAFDRPGVPLLLQFKLGQSPSRFVRSDLSQPAPTLIRPFFRFTINTAEADGQFEVLLKSEIDGAEVYYIAPRFVDWPHYVQFYEDGIVLENSVLVQPSTIRAALDDRGAPDGRHRVTYDGTHVHVCSKPVQINEVKARVLAQRVATRARNNATTLGEQIKRLYGGLEDRSAIRRERPSASLQGRARDEYPDMGVRTLDRRQRPALTLRQRETRLERLRGRSRTEEDAIAAVLGLELWGLGIQLLLAVDQANDMASPGA